MHSDLNLIDYPSGDILKSSRFRPAAADLMTADDSARRTPTKLLYDRKSASYVLSISTRSLDHLIATKRLKTIKLGRKVMIPHGELVRFSRQNHDSLSE